ncbi:MAG: polysaccharide deacetylase family protein, partial [Planctomycetaceae bacterium]|nr:polysaccharide deacetylase family protein [Planctomycetaceae bacterium]
MILMYHKVDIITPTIWWITPADLNRHLSHLKHRTFVSLDDYTSPDKQVVVTFDDAYENVFRHALPVLKAHGVPFEVFVIGGSIGRWNLFDPGEPMTRHMDVSQLDELTRWGGRLQWHTISHPNLPDLDDDALNREMTVPTDLAMRFPAPHFTWFSYPGGAHDERAVQLARKRFAGAVSVTDGQPNDRWLLNRVTADCD